MVIENLFTLIERMLLLRRLADRSAMINSAKSPLSAGSPKMTNRENGRKRAES